ncbi:MAG: DUF389 domain-containing protein [Acidimicrobiales bacterium]|nr:DUF389 domain-containing protein [Acidimicrobiales bacterium]
MSTADAPGSDLDLPRSDWLLGVPLRAFLRPRALQGVVLVAVAVALVVWPHRTDRALGLVVGLGCLAYAGFSLIDLGRHPDRRGFLPLVAAACTVGLGAALVSQPVESLTASAQAMGLALAALAVLELVAVVRHRHVTPWTASKTAGLAIAAALLLRFPEALLIAATAAAAVIAAAIGVIGVFNRERDLLLHAPPHEGTAGDGTGRPNVPRMIIGWIRARSSGAEDRDLLQEKLFFEGEASPVRYARFIALMAFASIIASVGVVVESTAVVIGAMLIAPLMVPLMGTAFSTVMGWPRRMARCLSVAASGIVLAITTGALVGAVLPRTVDVATNTEIVSRTSPTSVDLVIAVAAGAAGAYAMARRDVSDSLPGVAVAIALVPPLTVVGLCWQQQAWAAGNGALLLFLTNAVAILVAGGATFVLVGAAPLESVSESQERVATAIVALLSLSAIVVVLLVLNGSELARADLARAEVDQILADYTDEHTAFEVIGQRTTPDGTLVINLAGPDRPPELGDLLSDLHAASDGKTPVEVTWVDQQRVRITGG